MEIDECEDVAVTGNATFSNGSEFSDEIREGLVRIRTKVSAETFYNPVQEFNRDLTILVLRTFVDETKGRKNEEQTMNGGEEEIVKAGEETKVKQRKIGDEDSSTESAGQKLEGGIRVLDALSASGLRAVRFALEVPGVELVVANDFSEKAFETIRQNVELNGVQDRIRPVYSDAVDLMMEHRKFDKRFHAIDLDPYGSASAFLDSAVQAVEEGGILMVTCTDMFTLCWNTPEACYNKYGSVPLRHKSRHEMALRILLQAIDAHANHHERYIVPLLSVSIDFYIRCFVKLFTGAKTAKDSVTKLAHVFCCATCQSLDLQPLIRKSLNGSSIRFSANHFQSALIKCGYDVKDEQIVVKCTHCDGNTIQTGGPIWVAPIHDAEFVQKLLKKLKEDDPSSSPFPPLGTRGRLEGVLSVVSEELPDVPLYYAHDQLATVVRCPVPKLGTVRSALLNAGFRCSIAHCNARALKTDAPVALLWDIYREWAKKKVLKADVLYMDLTARQILAKKNKFVVDFTDHPKAISPSEQAGYLRFLNRNMEQKLKKARESFSAENRENWPIFEKCQQKPSERSTHSQPKPELPLHERPLPKTPDHYWDVGYPSREEQLQRGYVLIANSPLFKKKSTAKRRIL